MASRRVVLLSLALVGVGRAATASEAAELSPDIAAAIRRLDDDSYAAREAATEFLWAAGEAAQPALQRAAEHGDPEARSRAQRVLEKLKYGIFPDTPTEVCDLVDQYVAGDGDVRRTAISMLGDKGGYGIVVLAKLEEQESDEIRRDQIHGLLIARAGAVAETASILLANGDGNAAARMLEQAAAIATDDGPVRAYAAWLLLSGKLKQKIQALESLAAAGPNPKLAWRLALMHRADGDLQTAQAWADKSADAHLIENLLLERRDWPRLAGALGPADTNEDLRRTGLIAAVQRFAGDETAFQSSLARLRQLSKRTDTQVQAEMSMLLNDQVNDAVAIQLDRRAYLSAFDIYSYTGRFSEAIALVDKAATEHHPDAFKLMCSAARLLWRLGERDAQTLLDLATTENSRLKDFSLAGYLCEAEKEIGHTDRARAHALAALEISTREQNLAHKGSGALDLRQTDGLAWLFGKLYPGQEQAADIWWVFTLNRPADQSLESMLDRLTQVLGNQLPVPELEALCALMVARTAQANDKAGHERTLQVVADLLHTAGSDKTANEYLAQLAAKQEDRGDWVHIAQRAAEKNDWARAAVAYQHAAFRPTETPENLWQEGYCLIQAGQAQAGKTAVDKSKFIVLADERRRRELAEAMASRGLDDESRQQREMILRTGTSRGWYFYESCKHLGNDAARRGNYTLATEYWELFMLQVLDDGGSFIDERAYLDLPQLVHRNRARSLLGAGDAAGALRELRAYIVVAPASAQLVTDFAVEMDKAGHRTESDELCALVLSKLGKTSDEFPRCAFLHNDIAWAATVSNREPEMALRHALRAVELSPTDTNCLDTLAEVHFRAGRAGQAQALLQKCIELEPTQDRHRKRLEGFKAGKGYTP